MSTTNDIIQRPDGYFDLLHNTICSELETDSSKNEVFWVAMGNALEITGTEKTKIFEIIKKDIEDELYESQFKEFMPREDYSWHNAYFWLAMRKNDWVKTPDLVR